MSAPIGVVSAMRPELAAVLDAMPDEQRQRVYALIREHAGLPEDHPLSPELILSSEAHLDSLALVELAAAMEAEFGHAIPSMERLITVGDCLLFARSRRPHLACQKPPPGM